MIGSGEASCSVAAEMCQMLRAMAPSYPVLSSCGWRVHLFEDPHYEMSDFEQQRSNLRDRCLERAGVTLHKGEHIANVAGSEIVLKNGSRQSVGLVINACFAIPVIRLQGASGLLWPLPTGEDLALGGQEHVWVAAP